MPPRRLSLPFAPTRSLLILVRVLLLLAVSGAAGCRPGRLPAPQPPAPVTSQAAAPSQPGEALPALKILTTSAGIYELPASELKKAGLGAALDDPGRLRLFHQGQELPVWIFGQGKSMRLQFYARESASLYARENVYWLVDRQAGFNPLESAEPPAPPAQSTAPAAAPDLPAGTFLATARSEQNTIYYPQVDEGDHWFGSMLPAPGTQVFELALESVASGPAALRLAVWASTDAPAAPDHYLKVAINGQPVVEGRWDGRGWHILKTEFSTEALKDGANTLTVEAPGLPEVLAEVSFIDWVEIDYASTFTARADVLEFTHPGGKPALQGFSEAPQVLDITDPAHPELVAAPLEKTTAQGWTFAGQPGRRYLAAGPQGVLRPLRLEPGQLEPDLRAAGLGADYLAVGPADLLEALQPLLDRRAAQGLKVLSIPVESVYDQFNFGLPEPQAIQRLVQFAAQHWQPAPQYLLLVGDASYDPRGYLAPPEANRLPTYLVSTIFGGETASDLPFAQIDEDSAPDLAVGRLPARTPEQVQVYVEKALAYEAAAGAGSQPSILAVADGQDSSFAGDAQAFLDLFPGTYERELYTPQAGVTGANVEIASHFNQGHTLISYFGHGSVNMWGKDRLFSIEDVAGLANPAHLPVVINMTCLTGLFTHPKAESLAEALLWKPGGGAVAVLAPTSLTLPTDQSFLSRPLAEALQAEPHLTLGQALLQARQQVPDNGAGTQDVLNTFLFFGDPALKLVY